MIVRLAGKINGELVVLERKDEEWWEATIPSSLNGVYIVELTAYDQAGNVGYKADYIMTIDLSALCVQLERFPYYESTSKDKYTTLLNDEFWVQIMGSECEG